MGYYESIARTWERAAFIRARPVAGDIGLGTRFLAEIQPVVWRRTLDYTVMDDMKMMLRRPTAAAGWEGYNLKTGPNGIRAVEFLTHVLQLVGGGRSRALRLGSTLPALQALAGEGWIEQEQASALGGLYLSLRRAEHRLQMIADAQTHSLPRSREAIAETAAFLGHAETDEFLAALSACLDGIERHTAHRLFEDAPDAGSDSPLLEDEDRLLAWLEARGFSRPGDIAAILAGWMAGRIAATRGERARALLSGIMPPMLEHLPRRRTRIPLAAFAGFVEVCRQAQIFSLLDHNRQLTRLLGDILVLSPRLADRLRQHPMLFDLVLFGEFFQPLAPADDLESELRAAVEDQPVELALDMQARITRERQFRAEVQRLSGAATGRGLARRWRTPPSAIWVVRDLAIDDMAATAACRRPCRDRHGQARASRADADLRPDLVCAGCATDAVSSGTADGRRSLGGHLFQPFAQTLKLAWRRHRRGPAFHRRFAPAAGWREGKPAPAGTARDRHRGEAWLWEKLALGKARRPTPPRPAAMPR